MSLPVFFESPCRSRAVTAALYLVKVCAAVCALTLLLALPSQAGHWEISYSQAQNVDYLQQDWDHPGNVIPGNINHNRTDSFSLDSQYTQYGGTFSAGNGVVA